MTTTPADLAAQALKPCPFCGAGETHIEAARGVWNGSGFGEPVSVSVRHWCPPIAGQPSRMIERIGRDHASAVAAWNTRVELERKGGEPAKCQFCKGTGANLTHWNPKALPCEFCQGKGATPPSSVQPTCWCTTCRPITLDDMRFVVCPICGNKRCPRAADHRFACTGSNDPAQPMMADGSPADPERFEVFTADSRVQPEDDERDLFEAAYAPLIAKVSRMDCTTDEVKGLRDGDHYLSELKFLNGCWRGWQLARAAHPATEQAGKSDRWLCLLCKSNRPGYHGTLDDRTTPCPDRLGAEGGAR